MQYIFKNGFAISYMDGEREILFATPIPAHMLAE